MGLGFDMLYAGGSVVLSPIIAYRLWHGGKWRTDWSGRFGKGGAVAKLPGAGAGAKTLLIHAVSVGETNLIRQLVSQLENDQPELNIVIASTTNTGFEQSTKLYRQRHPVLRYPLDFTRSVARFLDRVQPDVVACVELEVWPNMIEQCVRRGIAVCVINGRISDRSFPRYRLFRPVLRRTFGRFAAAAMQTQAYADRIIALGAPPAKVCVLDTMKWDTADLSDRVAGADELAAAMGLDRQRPLIVLGSTGHTEEQALVSALRRAVVGDAQIVMAPRKPERAEELAGQFPGINRRSRPNPQASRTLFMLDTLGELRKLYSLADVVIVGRSFNGWGGSDPIEPAALGRPTIIGPDHHNFTEVVDALHSGDGIEVAASPDKAAELTAALLRDRDRAARLAAAGRRVVVERQGSTRRHVELLVKLLHG